MSLNWDPVFSISVWSSTWLWENGTFIGRQRHSNYMGVTVSHAIQLLGCLDNRHRALRNAFVLLSQNREEQFIGSQLVCNSAFGSSALMSTEPSTDLEYRERDGPAALAAAPHCSILPTCQVNYCSSEISPVISTCRLSANHHFSICSLHLACRGRCSSKTILITFWAVSSQALFTLNNAPGYRANGLILTLVR